MGNTKNAFSKKLPKFTLIYSLLTGGIIALVLGLQLQAITTTQQDHLAKALASQLAKVARNPMIQQDSLSLQVEVDDMLGIEGVQYAAIQDASNQVLAQAQHAETSLNPKHTFTSPITIENAVAGYSVIQLDHAFFYAPFQRLQMTLIGLWMAMTAGLLYLSFRLGSNLSERLQQLLQKLPASTPGNMDELSALEKNLTPLLVTREPAFTAAEHQQCTLLAIACKNLHKLENLLNQEHFELLMSQLDGLIDDAADLYGATRLSAGQDYAGQNADRGNNIYIEFSSDYTCDMDQNDHPLRALYFATAIKEVGKWLLDKQGVKLEIACSIIQFEQQLTTSQLLNERSRHKQMADLLSRLKETNCGDITMDDATRGHHSLTDINLSPTTETQPAESYPSFRVEALNDAGDKLVTEQLALLVRNF